MRGTTSGILLPKDQSGAAARAQSRRYAGVGLALACALVFAIAPRAAHADSSGEVAPGASSGGFTNATNLLACDNAVGSATSNNTTQVFSTFGLSLPPTAVISGIQVRARANDGSNNNRKLQISLSWNGGTSYTAALNTPNFKKNTALRDYIVGGSTVLWGRTWTPSELSNANFRVRAIAPRANGGSPANLDCIPVTVFWADPHE